MNPITYLRNTVSELKQISWPTREQTLKLTLIVIAVSILVASYIGALDFSFTTLLAKLVK